MTAAIHGAVLGSAAPHHPSCTCYQCSSPGSLHQASLDTRSKAPIANLVEDINSNLVSAGGHTRHHTWIAQNNTRRKCLFVASTFSESYNSPFKTSSKIVMAEHFRGHKQ